MPENQCEHKLPHTSLPFPRCPATTGGTCPAANMMSTWAQPSVALLGHGILHLPCPNPHNMPGHLCPFITKNTKQRAELGLASPPPGWRGTACSLSREGQARFRKGTALSHFPGWPEPMGMWYKATSRGPSLVLWVHAQLPEG